MSRFYPPMYERKHPACPDCQCPGATCDLCNGLGLITEVKSEEPYDRGDGVMYGGSTYTSKACPNGCPPPRAIF